MIKRIFGYFVIFGKALIVKILNSFDRGWQGVFQRAGYYGWAQTSCDTLSRRRSLFSDGERGMLGAAFLLPACWVRREVYFFFLAGAFLLAAFFFLAGAFFLAAFFFLAGAFFLVANALTPFPKWCENSSLYLFHLFPCKIAVLWTWLRDRFCFIQTSKVFALSKKNLSEIGRLCPKPASMGCRLHV